MRRSHSRAAAVRRITVRQIRTSTLVIVILTVSFVASGIKGFNLMGASGGAGLQKLADMPAIRALFGFAYNLTNAGGFYVWRIGSFMAVAVAIWAVLASTRVTRGAEDDGAWDLVLTKPIRRSRAIAITMIVLTIAAAIMALTQFVLLAGSKQSLNGSVLYSLGLFLFALDFIALGLVVSQFYVPRRRATGVLTLLLAFFYVIRMAGDASTSAKWLVWVSPFGWLAQLQAFAANRWYVLLPLLVVAVVGFAVTPVLMNHRDTGAGILANADTAPTRTWLLGSPFGLALRMRLGGVAAWGLGFVFAGVIFGVITNSVQKFLEVEPHYADFVNKMGLGDVFTPKGFVAYLNLLLAFTYCLYVMTAVHSEWSDEQAGRLDIPFANGPSRRRWLGDTTVVIGVIVVVFALVSGLSIWAGAQAGGGGVTFGESMAGALNTLALVLLIVGIAVACHGWRPGWALGVTGIVTIGGFMLALFGGIFKLPEWVIGLSPFHHMNSVPNMAVDWTSTAVMAGLGLILCVLGVAGYQRRDLA